MKVITWNTNSRAKEETLNKQCLFLDNQFDIITLQEITLKSQDYFKSFFKDKHVLSSFDLVSDTSIRDTLLVDAGVDTGIKILIYSILLKSFPEGF